MAKKKIEEPKGVKVAAVEKKNDDENVINDSRKIILTEE